MIAWLAQSRLGGDMLGLRKYLMIAAGTAAVLLLGYVWTLNRSNALLRAENGRLGRNIAAMTLQSEQSAIARDVERARAEREAKRSAALTAEIETILTGGIPDAPLHPDLADLVNGRNVQPKD